MTKDQLIELRKDVISGKIEAKKACEILFSNNTKSWHTKEWKEKRQSFLKESCEQFCSKETLTLQHIWHPREYGSIKHELCVKYGQLINEKYTIDNLINEKEVEFYFKENINQEEKEVCPKCD